MDLRRCRDVFRAFADPTRLRILNLLRRGELCVCDLVRVLGESQPKVSRHLGYLRRAGIVDARRRSTWMHYRLSRAGERVFRAALEGLCAGAERVDRLRRDTDECGRLERVLAACCAPRDNARSTRRKR